MKHVLVVEDDEVFRASVTSGLEQHGFNVAQASRGDAVQDVVLIYRPDLILLDVSLPGQNGFSVCRELRRRGYNIPVIMMSCERTEERDRVEGFELGADDYLLKPFSILELAARIRARLKRSSNHQPITNYQSGDLAIDLAARTVRRAGKLIQLPAKQFDLLVFLVQRGGEVVSRDELLGQVWGFGDLPITRTVDVHICFLRKKLEADPKSPRHILSDRSTGYRFV